MTKHILDIFASELLAAPPLPDDAQPHEVLYWLSQHPEVNAAEEWNLRFPHPKATLGERIRMYGYPIAMIILGLTLMLYGLTKIWS